jgi:hypothetical protein
MNSREHALRIVRSPNLRDLVGEVPLAADDGWDFYDFTLLERTAQRGARFGAFAKLNFGFIRRQRKLWT